MLNSQKSETVAFKTSIFLLTVALCALPTSGQAEAFAKQPNHLEQNRIRTLGQVEWRLRRQLVDYCADKVAVSGFLFHLADQGPRRSRATTDRTANRVALLHVFDGGPAQKAGLAAGDQITTIGQASVSEVFAYLRDPSQIDDEIKWRVSQKRIGSTLDVSFIRDGVNRTVSIDLEAACAPRIYVNRTRKFRASTDGKNISISSGLIKFTENSHELALIAGHELAHILVDKGKKTSLFGNRKLEDRADVLGASLAKCAGFDMTKAVEFWIRFKRRERFGWLRGPSHRSSAAREAQLLRALPTLQCPDIMTYREDVTVP